MKFMIGCNYWDSAHGTDMWRLFDENVIREDVKALAENGIRFMRVFPNWRDFQPVMKMYSWQGSEKEYRDYDEQPLRDVTGVDSRQIENFKTFAGICDEYGIRLIVSVVTGWMSGRLFLPRAVDGKNPISDPEVLMWTARYIKGFVNGVKDCKNIEMWDLGNECNCLGPARSRAEAYTWTAFVRNAIYAADPTRKISSGMHALVSGFGGNWTIKDQGEIVDYMTPHPYVSRTINNDIEPMNRLRTTLLPTVQCMFYSDIGGKPSIMQEQGAFSQALANAEMNADFARINLYSCLVHGVKGWLWWCGANHGKLTNTPYNWSMIEQDLGMIDDDRKPRPVAKAIKAVGEVFDSLPFEELPERETDAICLLTDDQNRWDNGSASFVLAKQAGFDLRFAQAEDPLPKSDLYIVPGITGWSVMPKNSQDALMENVFNGATAFISFDGGQFSHFEKFTGLRSLGIVKSQTAHIAKFDFGEIKYNCGAEILAKSIGAEILAENEEGNVVFSRFNYGKGEVYFLNMPLERNLAVKYNAYQDTSYYLIYRTFAKKYIENKAVITENENIGMTWHKLNENKYVVSALNYSDVTQRCGFRVTDGWKIAPIYGNTDEINKCDAAFFYAEKTK